MIYNTRQYRTLYITPSLSKWFQSVRVRITLISISTQPRQSLALTALDLIRPLEVTTSRVSHFPALAPIDYTPVQQTAKKEKLFS
jgi:hypothetical protein